MTTQGVRGALENVFSAEAARIVSSIVRVTGDWELAEDCLQDAFIRALASWEQQGVPANPGAWLTTVARNRAVDHIRRSVVERRALGHVAYEAQVEDLEQESTLPDRDERDDRLSLIFTCAHPALSMDARVALTLRTVAGLSVESIARSFLTTESTMTKRLVRARAKIKDAGIPYRVPPPELLAERASGVLSVLYLVFNEGYASTERGLIVDGGLQVEAIRLARLLVGVAGDAPFRSEAESLLALMLLQGSRNESRVTAGGRLVPLEEQDRSRWDRVAIAEAVGILNELTAGLAAGGGEPGPYFLQASIAAQYAVAESMVATDFARIAELYRELMVLTPSPVIELNHAVVVAMAEGPAAGLALVEELDSRGALEGYYLLSAARADLLRRLGRHSESSAHYSRALAIAPSPQERDYLAARIAAINAQA